MGREKDLKKSILIVATRADRAGGVETLLHMMIKALKDDFDISLLVQIPPYDIPRESERVIKHIFYLQSYSPSNPSSSRLIECPHHPFMRSRHRFIYVIYAKTNAVALSDLKFDAVIASQEGQTTMIASQIAANKKLAWMHSDCSVVNWFFNQYQDQYQNQKSLYDSYASFDKVVFVSERIKNSFIDKVGDPGNLVVRYNPIRVDEVIEGSRAPVSSTEANIPIRASDRVRFVMSGRISYQKGYDRLTEAVSILDARGLHGRYEVLIIGDEDKSLIPDQDFWLTLISSLRANDSIYCLGYLDNPFPVITTADWFLSTSRFEGQSLAIQEAALLGVPVIATDCAGVRELLGDSEYGIVTGHSAVSIADNMQRVIEDCYLMDHYKEKIASRTSIINYEERMQAILELI